MDRIQIAAIVLAVGMLGVWFFTLPREEPRPIPAVPSDPAPQPAGQESIPAIPPTLQGAERDAPLDLTQAETVALENDALRVKVSSAGGRIVSVELKHYGDRLGPDAKPVELVTLPSRGGLVGFLGGEVFEGLDSLPHAIGKSSAREVEMRVERDGVRVTRTLVLDEAGYGARLRMRVENQGVAPVEPSFLIALYGQEAPSDSPTKFPTYGLVASQEGDLTRQLLTAESMLACSPGSGLETTNLEPPVEWVGLESQYFLMVASVEEDTSKVSATQEPLGALAGRSVLRYPPVSLPAGAHIERAYRLYMGPKVAESVALVDPRLRPALATGWVWVRPLVDFFVALLVWTYEHVIANYGVAIILLTIVVRLVTAPLTHFSMKSMRRLGEVAPEMKVLQEKHKEDRGRLQQEMMSLYRRKGINPLSAMGGGCLPMLFQMPFLLALYFALQSSIELRHAPFGLWIQDLSAPENFFSIAGLPVRLLPLLMGASMVLQQRLMPSSAAADPSQRQMMTWMSVFFIFLFYSFPSGLVLYWFVSNILGIAQQLLINRTPSTDQPKS